MFFGGGNVFADAGAGRESLKDVGGFALAVEAGELSAVVGEVAVVGDFGVGKSDVAAFAAVGAVLGPGAVGLESAGPSDGGGRGHGDGEFAQGDGDAGFEGAESGGEFSGVVVDGGRED